MNREHFKPAIQFVWVPTDPENFVLKGCTRYMSTKVKSWKLLVRREIRTYCLVEMLCTFLKIIAKELDPHWADVNYSLRPPWKCTFHIWKKSSSIDGTLFLNFPGLGSSYSWKHKKKHFIYSKISRCHAKAACMPCMATAKAELLQKTQKHEFENYIFNKYKFLCCSCLSWNTSWSLDNMK